MLKVLQVPFTFFPDPVGGTEVYVHALAQELQGYDIESIVAAPSCKSIDETYEYCGLHVRRYRSAPNSKYMMRELYGDGDPEAGAAFARILDEETPDVVHLHALTRAISIHLVRAAKQRGIPVSFTYHTPTVSCQRGTLMLRGANTCDGVIESRRCADCALMHRGLPRWASMPLSYTPSIFAKIIERAGLGGSVWTALRMADLMRVRQNAFTAFMREVDRVVALREWIRTMLLKNGVPASKITLSPHGLARFEDKSQIPIDVESVPLRVAFLGRADRVKGLDTVVRAVRAAPELKIELDLYGVVQLNADCKYRDMVKSLAAHDARIKFLPPIPHEKVVPRLATYHLLAVPSRWMETGPLVVLESFAAGTPVIGSNLGGIAEWVRHEENGLLVEFDNPGGWTNAFRRCAGDRQLLERLREGVKPPRRMKNVAQEMVGMYDGMIRHKKVGHRPTEALPRDAGPRGANSLR